MVINTFPVSNGDILDAATINKFNTRLEHSLFYVGDFPITGLIAHSATAWTAIGATNTRRTADTGATWDNATTDFAAMTGLTMVSVADNTDAIVCDHNSNATFLAVDSGDTWVAANTDPASVTSVLSGAYPTASVAVVGCDIGAAARSVFIGDPSSGAGSLNWTICTTGPAVDTVALDMVDGSNGTLIDVNENIWTTTDGGDNWTDSTDGAGGSLAEGYASLIALTATTYVAIHQRAANADIMIETWASGANAIQRLILDGTGLTFTNLVKCNNTNIYFVTANGAVADLPSTLTLYKSEDSGATFTATPLPAMGFINNYYTTFRSHATLIEYTTDKMLLISGDNIIMRIDESWDP